MERLLFAKQLAQGNSGFRAAVRIRQNILFSKQNALRRLRISATAGRPTTPRMLRRTGGSFPRPPHVLVRAARDLYARSVLSFLLPPAATFALLRHWRKALARIAAAPCGALGLFRDAVYVSPQTYVALSWSRLSGSRHFVLSLGRKETLEPRPCRV